ncbi:hypothetical protein NPX13_g2084 [Xylaria arbuscula]|uniref:Uncharacterized protein n=1 Tax=Xylaria arbuscula TaxID=114810 RepID=A0A9W8TPI1_9PEZI|nr:hypothetical protein NPX13_g2084 [Xylaria arbuscula]
MNPPDEGWSIDNPMGKDDIVIDILRHIPYLRRIHPSSTSLLPIYPGVIPINYLDDGWEAERTHFYPLPSHCVYLAHRDDSQGTDLILDATSGAVTEWSWNGRITLSYEEYEMLPEAERWRAHPTASLKQLLDRWARMYKELKLLVSPNPIKRPCAVNFHFYESFTKASNITTDDEVTGELRREENDTFRRQREMAEKVYEVYVLYGWPDNFKKDDKKQLKADLLKLEEEHWAETKRIMDQHNPDAALFDSE